jgi:hypothetical protein
VLRNMYQPRNRLGQLRRVRQHSMYALNLSCFIVAADTGALCFVSKVFWRPNMLRRILPVSRRTGFMLREMHKSHNRLEQLRRLRQYSMYAPNLSYCFVVAVNAGILCFVSKSQNGQDLSSLEEANAICTQNSAAPASNAATASAQPQVPKHLSRLIPLSQVAQGVREDQEVDPLWDLDPPEVT